MNLQSSPNPDRGFILGRTWSEQPINHLIAAGHQAEYRGVDGFQVAGSVGASGCPSVGAWSVERGAVCGSGYDLAQAVAAGDAFEPYHGDMAGEELGFTTGYGVAGFPIF